MKRTILPIAAGLVLIAAGCAPSDDNSDGTVNVSLSIAPATAAAVASASVNGIVASLLNGPVDPSQIDSLMITVTRVLVLPDSLLQRCHPPEGDSARGFRPGRPPVGEGEGMRGPHGDCRPGGPEMGPFGPGGPGGPGEHHDHPPCPDSLMPPDTGWGSRPNHWYSLDVSGNGHIDLLHLPVNGLTLAAGAVPPGEYKSARLIISDATIWFNTAVVSQDGVTLQPNTGYAVLMPGRPRNRGIMTNAGFTIPEGGGNVQLTFDANATIGPVIVLDSGRVVMRPVLHPLH